MDLENNNTLKIGRLEDKITLYEPLLTSLQGIASIPTEIGKIHSELRTLRESRIEVRERLTTLFKTQARVYDDTVKLLEEKTKTLGRDVESFEDRLVATEKTIESFKLKGWDLLFRITPWVLAASASVWAVLQNGG